ncbi:class I SAM-dependent methyltransferase [Paenibacillus sp. J22TS3]|uniref:class I SAM-dependent methyltransferase n=1 Tax=Paenibacillus sp. J22TS3 TaxID=2807192 RepID=UPI001B1EEB33|nr:class I SAM-dependent methyltransferase [Paenibacillus sp. J22TS3]GIP22930.1 methyltransferase [Paenibacillus sp. J22TS3]
MPINFHDEQNRQTYAARNADESWISLINSTVDVSNKRIADIGCGGGIYTKALIKMGASHVVGVDFSDEMLKGAATNCSDIQNATFLKGEAYQSNLPANEMDMVLERALIHHLDDLDTCFKEAYRILKDGGVLIVQDRTPEDCLLPGDEHHIRGYFFEKFPRLMDKEISRRYDSEQVQQALKSSGFRLANKVSLWETRRIYKDYAELNKDLLLRTGRSILHELTDVELQELISFIEEKLSDSQPPIIEKDSWTVWFAIKE